MSWHDVSMRLRPGMPVYEGDPPFEVKRLATARAGDADSSTLSAFSMPSHAGTHVDAPLHFVPGGAGVLDLPLDALCGPARLVDLAGEGRVIDARALRRLDLAGVERLLIRTAYAPLAGVAFRREYPCLTPEAAAYLRREVGLRLLGVDAPSVDAWPDPHPGFGFPVHRALLEGDQPVVIVEGLVLHDAPVGDYELLCLPLPVADADGAPARVLLRRG